MPKIKVGDRVRLLSWEGECAGLRLSDRMRQYVGTIDVVDDDLRTDSPTVPLAVSGFYWPLSAVEKVS